MAHVYVLKCSDGSTYIGRSKNLKRRLAQHQTGLVAWTKSRLPIRLIYTELFSSLEKATWRERQLKTGWGRTWIKRKHRP